MERAEDAKARHALSEMIRYCNRVEAVADSDLGWLERAERLASKLRG